LHHTILQRCIRTLSWCVIIAISMGVVTVLAGAGGPASLDQIVASGVSPDATSENSQRKLVVDRSGRLSLVYVRPVGGGTQIFLASSADRGGSWSTTQVTRSTAAARLPSLAAFPDGTLHLVWTEYAPIGRVPYQFLRGTQWSEMRLLSQPGIYAGVPVIAPFAGDPYVLWYGIRPETPKAPTRHASIYEILETHASGSQWTPPALISPGVPDSINPSMDATADGHLHAAWFQFDGRAYQIRTADFAGTWSLPRTLTTGLVDHMRVAMAADGAAVHLIWEEETQPSRVTYLRLGGGEVVRVSGGGPARDPVIAAAGGLVAAAWSEGQSIVFRPLSPSGPSRIVGAGGGPAIAIDEGTAYLAWTRPIPGASEVHFTTVRLR
jgi:hypothetical protein